MESIEFKLPVTVMLPYDNYKRSQILLDWHCKLSVSHSLSVSEGKRVGQLNQLMPLLK